MPLALASYQEQVARWPQSGRYILAQYDDASVVVYQAFGPAIGRYAATHGRLGGHFQLTRMSWIKPNFLWMMYRCGWGTKEGQEVVLAIRIARAVFDAFLAQAVHTTFVPEVYTSETDWKRRAAESDVLLQWDPDHDPSGRKLERRALQLGLRGDALYHYARESILDIEGVSEFVSTQRQHSSPDQWAHLITPREEAYPVTDAAVASRLGVHSAISDE